MARAVHSEAQQCADGRQQRVVAPDVQERVLLAGEARVVEVFGGGGRADRDGRAQLLAGGQQFAGHVVRDRGGEQGADAGRRTVRRSVSARAARIRSPMPVVATYARYASVVSTTPGGTGRPALVSSPRFAPLPPASARSPRPTSVSCLRYRMAASVDLPTDKMPPERSGSATPGRGCGRRGGETIRQAGGTAAPPPRPSARTAGRPATSCRAARARGSRRARRRPAAA